MNDPAIQCEQANPFAIQIKSASGIDALAGTWYAGHVNDALILPAGANDSACALAGTDGGGA